MMTRGGGVLALLALVGLLAGCSAAAPSLTVTPTLTAQPSATQTFTLTPTRTPTPTATFTPTITPTLPPVAAGTPLPPVSTPIIQASLPQVRILAQWGRGNVQSMAWSPDGSRLAVATSLGVYLYNAGDLSNPAVMPTSAAAYQLAWSPDGRRLAVDVAAPGAGINTAIPAHKVQVWDVTGAESKPLALLDSGTQALALRFTGADGLAALVSVDKGAVLQRWDLPSLKRVLETPLTGGETAAVGVLSTNLDRAATRGARGPVRLWDLASGVNVATTPESGQDAGPMAFSPDGGLLAVGYPDVKEDALNLNQVIVWRWPQPGAGAVVQAMRLADAQRTEGLYEATISLAWSADGQYIAAGTADHAIQVFQAGSGWLLHRIETGSLPQQLAFNQVSGADQRLAAGGLEVYRVDTGQRVAQDDDYLTGLNDMRFLPDGSALALAGYGMIDLRSTRDGSRLSAITGMEGAVHSLAFNRQGNLMLAGCADGTTRLYQTSDGKYLAEVGEPTYPIYAADFSNNDLWIAASGADMRIRFFRLKDGVQMAEQIEPFVAYKLLFAPNSDQVASLTTSGVNLRDITGDINGMTFKLKGNVGGVGLTDMAYSQGSEFLALAGSNVVRVIDPRSEKDAYTIYETGDRLPWSVAFSPDNAFLAVGWSDGQIRLYWAQTGQLMRAWQAHPQSVLKLSFTRDSRLLASLGSEGTIRVWGVSEP